MTAYNDSQNLSIYSVSIFSLQADVDEDKIKHFQKLKELPPMQLRQVPVYMVNWEQEKGLKYTFVYIFLCLLSYICLSFCQASQTSYFAYFAYLSYNLYRIL